MANLVQHSAKMLKKKFANGTKNRDKTFTYLVIHNNIKQKIQAFLNEFPIHVKVTFLAKLNFVPVFLHAVNKQ